VYLFTASYGFGGLLGCLAVALKWLAPREPVLPPAQLPGLQSFQNAHLPLLLVLSSGVAWALGASWLATDCGFVVVGTYVAWWYLRFVHKAPDPAGSGFGDNSDAFAFVTLFPPSLRKYLAPLADFSYGVCLLLGFFKDRKV
jgi:hypothetical protein